MDQWCKECGGKAYCPHNKSGKGPATAELSFVMSQPLARANSTEDVYAAIRAQIEFYFGDQNYARDKYLQGLEDASGWVDIKALLAFPKLKVIAGDSATRVVRSFQALPERSRVVELDAKFPQRVRRLRLEQRINDYIFHRLSHKNFSRDLELQLLAECNSGWVPLESILRTADAVAIFRNAGIELGSSKMFTDALSAAVLAARASQPSSCEFVVSDDGASVRLCSLANLVRRQIEYYFSDSNFPTDRFLQEQTAASVEGFIALELIISFPRLRSVLLPDTPVECVADALRSSTFLELSSDACAVRRRDYCHAGSAPPLTFPVTVAPPPEQRLPQGPRPSYEFLPQSWPTIGARASTFSVLQFNLLADFLARTSQHAYCDRRFVTWDYRRQLLVAGIRRLRERPDLICLQEVQGRPGPPTADCHLPQLLEALEPLGYHSASYALRVDRAGRPDAGLSLGNAIIFNAHTFEPAEPPPGESTWRGRVGLAQLVRAQCERLAPSEQRCASEHYAPKWATQAVAWARLRHKRTGRTVFVVSCHIACCFDTPEVQVAQVSALLEFIQSRNAARHDDVVLAGDFNSKPDSGVYQLCTEGNLPADHDDANASPMGQRAAPQLCDARGFVSGVKLQSAYRQCTGAEPLLTNKIPSFQGE